MCFWVAPMARSCSPKLHTALSTWLRNVCFLQILKELCDRERWTAPSYQLFDSLGAGFVFQASMVLPAATRYEPHLTLQLRKSLKVVHSEPCGTHKAAKEDAAYKMIVILQGAGIRA